MGGISILSRFKTSSFNCKAYESVYNNIKRSYQGKDYDDRITLKGGGASGKSENVANNIAFWLPEDEGDEALVVLYSILHRNNTLKRFRRIFTKNNIKYSDTTSGDGTVTLKYGNNNIIRIISVKTNTIEDTEEKLKTMLATSEGSLKFIWFEEFTAILHTFKTLERFDYSATRLLRELKKGSVVFYTFNPPKNHRDIVYGFLRHFTGLTLHTTIYDLPKKWQSKEDLKEAEKLKETNYQSYASTYLGETVGTEGLAYNTNDILIDEPHQYSAVCVFTDNGIVDATSYLMFGIHGTGIDLIDTSYHSGRRDGQLPTSELLPMFNGFISEIKKVPYFSNMVNKNILIVSDEKNFTLELKSKGYKNTKYISEITTKNRALYYSNTKNMIDKGIFKILNTPNNQIVYEQLSNAEKTETSIRGIPKTVVAKVDNRIADENFQLHGIDPIHYMSLVMYPKMKG